MAGPWFTVQESGSDWHRLDTVSLSNGNENSLASIEIRLELEDAPEKLGS